MNKNNVPKLWIDSLDVDPSFMEDLLKKDTKIMYSYGVAVAAIKSGKYRNDPRKQRMKMAATKNDFIDLFIYKYLKRKNTVIKIKNKLIIEYDFNKRTKENEYQLIMKELDSLLISNQKSCQCRNIAMGFCFHRRNGEFIY
jgi:bisphosphoglycerate-independent phosphoglycerate mutase (AlkP superfamily)